MARINPDRSVRHGRHVDHYWPGVIHSVWQWRCLQLRRERVYADQSHQELIREHWQLHCDRGRRRLGVRYEVDE